jgi:hypothetical protein
VHIRRKWFVRSAATTVATTLALMFGTIQVGASPTSGIQPGTTIVSVPGNAHAPGLYYCAEHKVLTWTTQECIWPESHTLIQVGGNLISGSSFTGHIELTGPFTDTNTPTASYGSNTYNVSGTFSSGTYCATLWKFNGGVNFRNMGTICGVL